VLLGLSSCCRCFNVTAPHRDPLGMPTGKASTLAGCFRNSSFASLPYSPMISLDDRARSVEASKDRLPPDHHCRTPLLHNHHA